MTSKEVKPDDFADEFMKILEGYAMDLRKSEKEDVKAAAKVAADQLKNNTPAGAGEYSDWDDYNRGWRTTVKELTTGGWIAIIKQNKKFRPLTHLLERGHVNVDGSRARAFPHVAPAAKKGVDELKRRLSK